MKKSVLLGLFSVWTLMAIGQCTIDQGVVQTQPPGLYPTIQDGIDPGALGVPYSQEITFITMTDTTVVGTTYLVDSVIPTLGSAPDGLTILCNIPNCHYMAGDSGCLVITGTPTSEATSITIDMMVYSNFFISPLAIPYEYAVNMVGIEENLDPNRFGLSHNRPNPFNAFTDVVFVSPRANERIEFSVYDMLGKKVHSESLRSSKGVNSHRFDRPLETGLYIYTLSNGSESYTRRMTVL